MGNAVSSRQRELGLLELTAKELAQHSRAADFDAVAGGNESAAAAPAAAAGAPLQLDFSNMWLREGTGAAAVDGELLRRLVKHPERFVVIDDAESGDSGPRKVKRGSGQRVKCRRGAAFISGSLLTSAPTTSAYPANLTVIDLSDNPLLGYDGGGARKMVLELKRCGAAAHIQELRFANCGLGTAGCQVLADDLFKLSKSERRNFFASQKQRHDTAARLRKRAVWEELEQFLDETLQAAQTPSDCDGTSNGGASLPTDFSPCFQPDFPSLTCLDLAQNAIDDDACLQLCFEIFSSCVASTLENRRYQRWFAAKAAHTIVSDVSTTIVEVGESGSPDPRGSAAQVVTPRNDIPPFPLQSLDLSRNSITDASCVGLQQLVGFSRRHSTSNSTVALRTLNLAGNCIGDDGMVLLADGLRQRLLPRRHASAATALASVSATRSATGGGDGASPPRGGGMFTLLQHFTQPGAGGTEELGSSFFAPPPVADGGRASLHHQQLLPDDTSPQSFKLRVPANHIGGAAVSYLSTMLSEVLEATTLMHLASQEKLEADLADMATASEVVTHWAHCASGSWHQPPQANCPPPKLGVIHFLTVLDLSRSAIGDEGLKQLLGSMAGFVDTHALLWDRHHRITAHCGGSPSMSPAGSLLPTQNDVQLRRQHYKHALLNLEELRLARCEISAVAVDAIIAVLFPGTTSGLGHHIHHEERFHQMYRESRTTSPNFSFNHRRGSRSPSPGSPAQGDSPPPPVPLHRRSPSSFSLKQGSPSLFQQLLAQSQDHGDRISSNHRHESHSRHSQRRASASVALNSCGEQLSAFPRLRIADFSGNPLGPVAGARLVASFLDHAACLEVTADTAVLGLARTGFGSDGARELRNYLTDASATALGLLCNGGPRRHVEVDLRDNAIADIDLCRLHCELALRPGVLEALQFRVAKNHLPQQCRSSEVTTADVFAAWCSERNLQPDPRTCGLVTPGVASNSFETTQPSTVLCPMRVNAANRHHQHVVVEDYAFPAKRSRNSPFGSHSPIFNRKFADPATISDVGFSVDAILRDAVLETQVCADELALTEKALRGDDEAMAELLQRHNLQPTVAQAGRHTSYN